MVDIYYEPSYGELYEKIENGKCEIFEYKNQYGVVYHMFIKREIETKVDDTVWYDLITPYGYGGPIIKECKKDHRTELIKEFEREFTKYCKKNRVVSEFIRFHPILENANDFKNMYDVSYIRNTVGTNLADFDDPFQSEFSKSCRKSVRRGLKAGVTYRIIESPNDIKDFKKIYYSTMDRNEASDYYYFEDNYFEECLDKFKDHVILVEAVYEGKVIAAGFYFVYRDIIHAHISGTLTDYLYLSPAYIIKYATVMWGKSKNLSLIHYGGGISNSDDDPLYKFKRKFGKNTEFKFYIGKKIWNEEIYQKLCKIKGIGDSIDYFPAYREK